MLSDPNSSSKSPLEHGRSEASTPIHRLCRVGRSIRLCQCEFRDSSLSSWLLLSKPSKLILLIFSSERTEDGKSYVNPPVEKKRIAYTRFVSPIHNGRRAGFDVHVYFLQTDPEETLFANELWERIRRECKQESTANV